MKATINAKGELHIYAESGLESFALTQFSKETSVTGSCACTACEKTIFHEMDDESTDQVRS